VQNLANSRIRRIATRLRLLRQDAQGAHQEAVDVVEPDDNERVWPAVKALPQRQRDIIELVFCREMTIEEASKVMGVTTGTGRVHYDRAKKALRSRLVESLVDTE
jgi:RNA polymerase sigma factor (sigma-70 family)